ncbi:GntR family transcriptional regulator [Humibacter ginsenosidimutans]|uniref:GntR family transcriptional regulator n=1 Tax=Humibacter ginsenosidimutans TaxID=2599293 RepID=A0A5B8M602_9MICO|nr:GntR family transcriptional regulator [Humibacter ginsenosidimutans]QDZ16218.1 GntR family transcriptional regulator [Humibacter ginsenosidimutans]
MTEELVGGFSIDYPDPLWMQAVDTLREQVTSGVLRPGMRLPPERELCGRLGISRVTLRKALTKLVDEGVVRSSHGRGWYVAGEERNEWPNSLESFSETAARMGLVPTSVVLSAAPQSASLDDAEALAIAPGTLVFRLERVRMLNDVPIAVDSSMIPLALIPGAGEVDFRTESLYETLVGAGLDLAHAETTIEARPATDDVAGHLGIAVGDPTLVMHQLVRTRAERPVLVSTVRYAGDRYRLRTFFARAGSHGAFGAE